MESLVFLVPKVKWVHKVHQVPLVPLDLRVQQAHEVLRESVEIKVVMVLKVCVERLVTKVQLDDQDPVVQEALQVPLVPQALVVLMGLMV